MALAATATEKGRGKRLAVVSVVRSAYFYNVFLAAPVRTAFRQSWFFTGVRCALVLEINNSRDEREMGLLASDASHRTVTQRHLMEPAGGTRTHMVNVTDFVVPLGDKTPSVANCTF